MANEAKAARIRAWWWHRQGLDGSLSGSSPAEVLERSGWARSVGGVGPYLTLFSRAGLSRDAADRALAKIEIHELPTARGCTYVLPACDFALGLSVAPRDDRDYRIALKLGVAEKEIEKLKDAIVAALAKGPMDPDTIREETGKASRSLGEAGKKKGITTTLPIALGQLQLAGDVRRVPTNGRLDQQRYRYALWRPNLLARFRLSKEEAAVELARRFFLWIAPATLVELQRFSGWSGKACRAASEPLKLVPIAPGDERLVLPEDHERFERFRPDREPQYALVSSLDSILLLRRDLSDLLEAGDSTRKVFDDRAMVEVSGLKDLPSHAILDRGRLVGLWEFDPERAEIAWTAWTAGAPKKDHALLDAIERTRKYVAEDLGDARSFSLDSPKSRGARIASIRKAGVAGGPVRAAGA